jgi:hypothetical protein
VGDRGALVRRSRELGPERGDHLGVELRAGVEQQLGNCLVRRHGAPVGRMTYDPPSFAPYTAATEAA